MHIRVESPYVPVDGELAAFRALTGQKAAQLQRLFQKAGAASLNSLHKLTPLSHGKYVFVAFDTENDLPVALATCIIMAATDVMSYGAITDFAVLPEHQENGIEEKLLLNIIARMSNPSVLAASFNRELVMLRVAISSHLTSRHKIFEACGFELIRSNGENLYERRLGSFED